MTSGQFTTQLYSARIAIPLQGLHNVLLFWCSQLEVLHARTYTPGTSCSRSGEHTAGPDDSAVDREEPEAASAPAPAPAPDAAAAAAPLLPRAGLAAAAPAAPLPGCCCCGAGVSSSAVCVPACVG